MHKPRYLDESEGDDLETGVKGFLAALAILTTVPLMILSGFVLEKLWGWFVVPLGAPDLTVPSAIGLSLVAAFLTHQYSRWSTIYPYSYYAYAVVMPLAFWGIGWLVHLAA